MSDIVLSAGVRQNLLALQSTAQLMSITQHRLATGKKVNSALDNPANYFASLSLTNRASDLNALLDSIGQAQKTLEATDQGISSLTKLVESAKSIAKQASQAPVATGTYGQVDQTGTFVGAEALGTFTAGAYAPPGGAGGTISFTVTVDGTAHNLTTVAVGAADTVAQVQTALQNAIDADVGGAAGHATVTVSGGTVLKVDALDFDTDITITASAITANVGLTVDGTTDRDINSTSLFDNIGAAGTLTLAANGGATQTITFGEGAGLVSTKAELNTALAGLTDITGSANATTVSLSVAASATANSLTIGGTAAVLTELGLTANTYNGVLSTPAPDATRASLQSDYNNVLAQIDALAQDANYNGVNLLYGDNLKVVFNEIGTSVYNISGVTDDSAGLGLTAATGTYFQDNANITATIASIDTALGTLRAQAAKFGSTLTTVQVRQDFTKNLINTLQTGADALVLADTNEEGANLLALQTRQQLSTTSLSLAAQADQAVLRLFG